MTFMKIINRLVKNNYPMYENYDMRSVIYFIT